MWPVFSFPVNLSSMFGAPTDENIQQMIPNSSSEDRQLQSQISNDTFYYKNASWEACSSRSTDMDVPNLDSGSEGNRTDTDEVRTDKSYLSAFSHFRLYVIRAAIPELELGASAPPLIMRGHRTHLNLLAVGPAPHRTRFTFIRKRLDSRHFHLEATKFCDTKIPFSVDEASVRSTGYELTMSTDNPPTVIKPNNMHELNTWFISIPFQTLTRVLHIAFPELLDWHITSVPYSLQLPRRERSCVAPDPDGEIWTTYVWRKTPPAPTNIETYYRSDSSADIIGECRVVFAVQPPWVLGEADVQKFLKTKYLRVFNEYDPNDNKPYDSGERIWAKLWDTCARHNCHHWVLTSYHSWVFGAFTQGFGGGRILCHQNWDHDSPTTLLCLVYHVAAAMGMTDSVLPDVPEPMDNLNNLPITVPPSRQMEETDFADSGSDWDGMDDEPEFPDAPFPSSTVSNYGKAQAKEDPYTPMARFSNVQVCRLTRTRTDQIFAWSSQIEFPPPVIEERERSPSPVPSVGWITNASLLEAAEMEQDDIPRVVLHPDAIGTVGGVVLNVVTEDPPEPAEWII